MRKFVAASNQRQLEKYNAFAYILTIMTTMIYIAKSLRQQIGNMTFRPNAWSGSGRPCMKSNTDFLFKTATEKGKGQTQISEEIRERKMAKRFATRASSVD